MNGNYSAYEIVLCKNASRLLQMDNVTGEQPNLKTPTRQDAIVRFTEARRFRRFRRTIKDRVSSWSVPVTSVGEGEDPVAPADLLSPEMTAQVKATAVAPITILLRRLACPHLPPQPDSAFAFL